MVAAIQAAKNQLEVDKSKHPPSSSQPTTPLQHQRSKSFTNTTNTNTNIIQSNNSPLPPTNIVSFNPKSSNNNTNNANTNQPIALNRSVSDTAAAAHPYHNNTINRNHELDYIHPDYQYSDNNDNDNDTITSSLSGTLPEYNSTNSYMRRSSSHSGVGIGSSGGIQQQSTSAAATIQPALTKDHLKHLPAQSAHNIDAAFSSKMNLLPPLNNNNTNSIAISTVDGQLNSNNNVNNAQQQVNNSINNYNNNSKLSEKETNNNTKGRTVEEIMSAYQGKVDTILNKRDANNHGGSSTSVGSRGSNNNNSSSTSLGAALATLNNNNTSQQQQQYLLSSSKSVGNNSKVGENRTAFNASKSVGNPTTSITSSGGVVDLSSQSILKSSSGGGESKIDDILSTYKQKVGEIMAKSNNNNNNNQPTPYHHNLDDSDRGYNTDDNGGTTTRSVISRQPSLAVDNVILDDEESIGSNREAALDYDNRRDSGAAGSYKSCNSGSDQGSEQGSQGSYHSREEDSRERSDMLLAGNTSESTLNNDMMAFNNNNVISNKVKDHLGSMSERANAILQSINNNSKNTNNSGGDNSTTSPAPENDDNHGSDENRTRSNSEASTQSNGDGEEEGSYDNDSYISGASSASEVSSQIEGAAYGYHDNRPPPQSSLNESSDLPPPQAQLDTSPLRRKDTHDSLQRAQAAISSPIKSSSAQQQGSGDTNNDTTSDRKYRQDFEKKVRSEANTQREMEYTQLETKLNEAQSQLDTLQAQARTTKYSSSEQASRIKDLERKLKNEKENNAELKRERDAMKDEYDQDLEEQKDINRQLEQMVMSEEFEKELEDEINQVKELEHANRRFKVKIDSKCIRCVCFVFCAHLVSTFVIYERMYSPPTLSPSHPHTQCLNEKRIPLQRSMKPRCAKMK